jgi:hypothetical protein
MYKFQQRLKNFKQQLWEWNKNVFGDIFLAQKSLEQRLEDIQQESIVSGYSDTLLQEETTLKKQLEDHHKQEEILWKKKSQCSG